MGLGKAKGRRLYCNTPTTDNAVQNLYLKAYRKAAESVRHTRREKFDGQETRNREHGRVL